MLHPGLLAAIVITSNELCTSKPIGNGFGSYSGLCPEAPTQQGTYLMSGVAHFANTNRIRSDLPIPDSRKNSRDLMVSTYGIALATNVPKIDVKSGDYKSHDTAGLSIGQIVEWFGTIRRWNLGRFQDY